MRFRFIILTLLTSFHLWAQIPVGYYNAAQGLKGQNLKVALHNIIKNHTVIPYSGLWTAFQKTDKKPNGKVWDIYSYKPVGAQPYEYTFVTNQCGSYNSEADCYNREHTWPQSWFNSESTPGSDLFHIYASDGYVNNQRANFPYGNVNNPSWTSQNGSKIGPCSNTGYASTAFEPIDEFKGDLARSYFYMSTRYYSEDAGWSTSPATNKSEILSWQLNVLLQWHHQDPVSTKEIARNDSIYYFYQANRNPFIDNPAFADSIWAAAPTYISDYSQDLKNYFQVYPQPAKLLVYVQDLSSETEIIHLEILNMNGSIMRKQDCNNSHFEAVSTEDLAEGLYIIRLNTSKGIGHFKLLKQ